MRYIDAIKEKGRAANSFFELMGIDVIFSGEMAAGIRMTVTPSMTNGEGWLQGGMYTALADEAMVLALYNEIPEDATLSTIAESTQFLAGAREGVLAASGKVVKIGRRVAFAEGEVREESSGRLLSCTQASYAVIMPALGK
jgi:acyl-CoA thioesterase